MVSVSGKWRQSMISDHGWDTLLTLLSPLVGVVVSIVSAHYAKSASKQAKINSQKSDQLMQQTMRGFLIQVLTGHTEIPLETFEELYRAYYEAGGNHEIRDMAVSYMIAQSNKEDK